MPQNQVVSSVETFHGEKGLHSKSRQLFLCGQRVPASSCWDDTMQGEFFSMPGKKLFLPAMSSPLGQ